MPLTLSLFWRRCFAPPFLVLAAFVFGHYPARAQGTFNVLTRSYNNQRTGANLSETALNALNVNSSQFGKLFMLPVDDQVYAGILYVSALQIGGGTHNVIFVATTNNTVYAFDADTPGLPLWSRNFNGSGHPSAWTDVALGCGDINFTGNIGIVGTPVIDGSSGTMYFVTRTVESGTTVQRLRAIDITTGQDRANSPRVIQASVPGTADGGTNVVFNPAIENQRVALALSQGVVYIAWGAYCDTGPYHGWVLAYDSTSLAQVGAFNDTPNGSEAGIWMSGAGPAFDTGGNAYFITGNGDFDGGSQLGESLVKLAPGSLGLVDFFAPSNYNTLNASDLDFGVGGPTMVPGTNLLVTGTKQGKIYLLNTSNLGHEVSGDAQIPQFFQAADPTVRPGTNPEIHNNVTWNSPQGLNLYVWGENDYLRAFQFNPSNQRFTTPAFASGSILPPIGGPGGMLTVSANGSQTGTGIVWASVPRNGDAGTFDIPGNLSAFNAETLALLWSSTGIGDDLLNFSKGSIPVVANGKVYVGSISKFVSVYGARSSPPPSQNLALNKTASGSSPCTSGQTPDKAFNGSFAGGLNDEWCSSVSNPYLLVDLGAPYPVSRFVVEHAGAGGESFDRNTAAFNIQVSTDGVNFTTVVNVTGNIASITTHDIAPATARYVRLNIITPTHTADTSARIYEFQVFSFPPGSSADFSLSATPSSQTLTAGNSTSYTATIAALNGFSGTVTLSASGLPSGATASFSPATVIGAGGSTLSVSTFSTTPAGTYTVTIGGTWGSLQHSANVTLVVNAAASGGAGAVNLTPAYNRTGIVTDGTTFSGGLDQVGSAYSANLLGSTVSWNGNSFTLGPANAPDAVTSATVTLPAGQFATLAMLATGVNGNQPSQTFTVHYGDGTSTTFTQSLSDWFTPQNYAGEGQAVTMAYRDQSSGAADHRTFYLYGYTLALNGAKTVSSITLPNNANVVVLAMTLTAVSVGSSPTAPSGLTVAGGGPGPIAAAVQGYINSTFLTSHTTSAFDSTGGDSIVLVASSHFGVTFTPSDNFGNNWISIGGPTTTNLGFDLRTQIWYAPNPTVGPGHTVTMNLSQAMSLVMSIIVVKGSNISSPIDAVSLIGSDNGTQTVNVVSPSITTTGTNDLLIGFAKVSAGATFQAGTGFTQQAAASSNVLDAETGPAATPGSYTAPFTLSATQTWQSAVVAASNNPNQKILQWTASTEAGGTINNYLVERCQGAGCASFVQIGTTTTTTYNDIGLTASTSYSYRVRAQDTSGNLGPYSAVVTDATLAPIPSLPGNLTTTSPSNTEIDLSWTASTETGGTISSYLVERCQGATCTNFAQIGTSVGTTYNDTGLTNGVTYNYRVRATDRPGTVAPTRTSPAPPHNLRIPSHPRHPAS